jgi:hypothetical protein
MGFFDEIPFHPFLPINIANVMTFKMDLSPLKVMMTIASAFPPNQRSITMLPIKRQHISLIAMRKSTIMTDFQNNPFPSA